MCLDLPVDGIFYWCLLFPFFSGGKYEVPGMDFLEAVVLSAFERGSPFFPELVRLKWVFSWPLKDVMVCLRETHSYAATCFLPFLWLPQLLPFSSSFLFSFGRWTVADRRALRFSDRKRRTVEYLFYL